MTCGRLRTFTKLRESCEGASHDCAQGCEERQPGAKLKALVELENESGETKKALFFKQKHTMDTFLATGALTKEQYVFSLSGLVVKMGFDFDILKEEK